MEYISLIETEAIGEKSNSRPVAQEQARWMISG
jgi:hypothetical protein